MSPEPVLSGDLERVPPIRVSLTVTAGLLERFCLLTGHGFAIQARVGATVRDFVCGQLGVAPEYLEQRIQTIFLNGRVVDDPETATVAADSTIALSAGMPGIAGIMLRKRSPYAPMRSLLTYDSRRAAPETGRIGVVVVKLFNLVQHELGPQFLGRGIRLRGAVLSDLLRRRPGAFRPGILGAEVAGAAVAPDRLFDPEWVPAEVLLTVHCEDARQDRLAPEEDAR